MALLQWDSGYSVNILEIDGQHRKLFDLINELHGAMKQGKGKDSLATIINGLIAYAGTHFRTEEKYFQQFGYPDAEGHKKQHAEFTKKVAEFRTGFAAGKIGLTLQVMNFLSEWLVNHIKGEDKKYGPFLNAKGLK